MKLLTNLTLAGCFFFLCGMLHSCAKDEVETMGTIYGIVNDSDNGEPVQDAHVSLTPYGKTINTGSDGSYEFQEMEPGQYTIQISKSGYKTNTKRISVVAGEKASGDMVLQWGTSRIKLNIASLNFGSQSTSKTFTVRNISTSGTSVSWSVAKSSPAPWLSISPSSGSTAYGKESTVVVNVDREQITKDETAILLVEADGESLSVEVSVLKNGEGGNAEGGTCEMVTPFDSKLKTEFVQCAKIGTTVEFRFKITNEGDDVTLRFDTSSLQGFDSEGNSYTFKNSELWMSDKRITEGGTKEWTFPKNNPVYGRVVVREVPSATTSLSRYEVVIFDSKPWATLNKYMEFENVRW